ncbi:MAG: M28 family peptidase [Muribaculaceae bacterium]|nr:M28 family peptidase [Muribaculaceae bacterium]
MTFVVLCAACSTHGKAASADSLADPTETEANGAAFSADSAYAYVERQVGFGPRVPNTEAHRLAGEWLVSELKRHGAQVVEQPVTLTAFDGTRLAARNIMGRYNPDSRERLLLLAHWDCRPWADEDADESKQAMPVDGANDGASGVGVLLEIARQLGAEAPGKGVDILFVDAEDWGNSGDSDSWALGARHFVANPPIPGYTPDRVILLDMVGGKDAKFYREYFSEQSAPDLNDLLWQTAGRIGHGDRFINRMGTGVTDDHLEFIKAGVQAVDIIEYRPGTGFNEHWHTSHDNMEGISRETLGAVGKTVMTFLRDNY